MSEAYEEKLQGNDVQRLAPGERHEAICSRLHAILEASVANFPGIHLNPIREAVRLSDDLILRPDLSLLAAQTKKLWLAVEVVSSDDHRIDTVVKKEIYEAIKLPRLWMVDPRYDNIEVYHTSAYGLALKGILAGREALTEALLPEFQLTVGDLFVGGTGTKAEESEASFSHGGVVTDGEQVILEFMRQNPTAGFSRMEIARKAVRRKVFEEDPRWADAPLNALLDRKVIVQDRSGAFRLNEHSRR